MQNVHPASEPSNEDYFGESLLIEDYPIQVLPKLAVAIGLNESIVVQQLFWLFKCKSNGRIVADKRWIFNTLEEWQEQYFPFWSTDTIGRLFVRLEQMQVVISCQPEGGISRRKYYRLNDGMVNLFRKGKVLIPKRTAKKTLPSPQPAVIGTAPCHVPITETSCRDNVSKGTKESPSHDGGTFTPELVEPEYPATWKPYERSKDQKLAAIRPPANYPSEREFDAFCLEECEGITDYRPDLYRELCVNKWHRWNESARKWQRIRNWKAFVAGLDNKIADAKHS